jgi:nitroimidazol reductase NimA-like FMN-containing flavoprotein (pyridoxamine 5'-phosphate oxidase superfamily)
MAVIEGRTWLEILSPVACERHLRSEEVGRIALIVDDHPEIFPVNYAVDDNGDIYFRTAPGTKLHALSHAQTISLEIDGLDEERHLGWSVLVVGMAVHIGHPDEIAHARGLPLQPWASGEKAEVVRLRPAKTTGRRLHRPVRRHTPEADR